jgi:excisionase family DNA binding protein
MTSTDVLTLAEAAAECRVSVETIRRQISRGELAAFKVGRQVRIPADALATRQRMSRQRLQPATHRNYERKSDQRL